jgi:tRNA C32,U32 (ribose-2'-O)-methylase TrmJ
MIDARSMTARRSERSSKDLELMVHTLQQAVSVIDECDPDRNPARCMRQLRRLLDNTDLRVAIARAAADMPLKTG